jgi:hypothetical protein
LQQRRIGTGANDLAGGAEIGREIGCYGRVMLDRAFLVRNVFAVRVAGVPAIVGEQPDVDAEFGEQIDAELRGRGRYQMLLDRL